MGRFDVERTNGAWRGGFGDNENLSRTETVPVADPASQPQWTSTTLPYKEIVAASTGRFPVYDNTSVTEIPAGGTTPVVRPDGPTAGSTARAGGGGDYLSNEIAYRATLLRDRLGLTASLPGGHVHTPVLQFGTGNTDPASGTVTDPRVRPEPAGHHRPGPVDPDGGGGRHRLTAGRAWRPARVLVLLGSLLAASPRPAVAGHQGGARDRAGHQEDGDEGDEEGEGQRGAEAPDQPLAGAEHGEAVAEYDAAALQGDRRQFLGEEEAGDEEADHRDDGLPDERDEPEREEQHAPDQGPAPRSGGCPVRRSAARATGAGPTRGPCRPGRRPGPPSPRGSRRRAGRGGGSRR